MMSNFTSPSANGNAVLRLIDRFVVAPWAEWRGRRLALAELSRLDDHMLADIGISRGEIPGIVSGELPPRRAVNENKPSAAA